MLLGWALPPFDPPAEVSGPREARAPPSSLLRLLCPPSLAKQLFASGPVSFPWAVSGVRDPWPDLSSKTLILIHMERTTLGHTDDNREPLKVNSQPFQPFAVDFVADESSSHEVDIRDGLDYGDRELGNKSFDSDSLRTQRNQPNLE